MDRSHAPNRDACTVTVRYEYMYRATPNIYIPIPHTVSSCSTTFSPGCESPEPKSPHPPLKPHANPYLLKHGPPPNLTTPKKNLCETFLCNSKCATHRWVGLYKPPVVKHSPLCALDTFHALLCVHNPTKDSAYMYFTCSCTTNHLVLFPSQLLDSQCFSLHMYSIYVKHSYSLYSLYFFILYLLFLVCIG